MNNFETIEEIKDFACDISVGFLDSMKYDFSSGEMTEEKLSAYTDCIENMKECISAYEYYSKQQNNK